MMEKTDNTEVNVNLMNIVILFGIIMIGFTITKDWDKPIHIGKDRHRLQPIERSLSLSDSIPIDTLEYPKKCFGAVELTKRQQKEMDKYGCYCPLIN